MLAVFRLSAAERRFSLISFAVKVAIFWAAQLGVCVLDPRRLVCGVVERGFQPCLISFAVMDFVVIPQLRRRWDR
ncbi:putative membrane protein [Synechococcus sp. RS9902]|nr:putative membrane protein [Synechococcus sp. RS9902]